MKFFLRIKHITKTQITIFLILLGLIISALKVIEINWSNVLEGLIVGAIITLAFTFWLPFLLNKLKRPDRIEIWDKNLGTQFVKTTTRESMREREFKTNLIIVNRGKIPITNGLYWHLCIPKHISVDIQTEEGRSPNVRKDEQFTHIQGQIKNILFPERATSLHFELKGVLPKNPSPNDKIYYFFSTEFGLYPKSISNEFATPVDVNDMYFLKIR